MSIRLKIFLIIICLIFDIVIYKKIANNKIEFKSGLYWGIVSFVLILVTIFDKLLIPIKNFLGFEEISNMIFLIGFVCIILLVLSLSIKFSQEKAKVVKLTQELALLKKEVHDEKVNK